MDELSRANPDLLSPYAPIRWRRYLWWQYAEHVAKEGRVLANGNLTTEFEPRMQQEFVVPEIKEAAKEIKQNPDSFDIGGAIAKTMEIRHWAPLVAQYELNGRQIFDVSENLTELLLNTDVKDCTLSGLNLPYDGFFLRFGKQDSIKTPWDKDEGTFEYVDGAMIAVTPYDANGVTGMRLKIGLSTVKENGVGVLTSGYFLDFTPNELLLNVDSAIDRAIERRRLDIGNTFNAIGSQMMGAIGDRLINSMEEGSELARKTMPLVINALFYLESLPTLPPEGPGRDTSSELVSKWNSSKPDRQYKLKSQLKANGYTVVRLVGREIETPEVDASETGASKRPHWRRGYWRENQAYGPKNSLRKRVLIKPVLVNAAKANADEIPGHIYKTQAKKSGPTL